MEKLERCGEQADPPGSHQAAAARALVLLHPSLHTFHNEFQESLNAFRNGSAACVLHSHLHNKDSHFTAGRHGLLCVLETKAEKKPLYFFD